MACGDPPGWYQHTTNPTYWPYWVNPPNRWWPTYYPSTPTVKYNYCPQCGIKLDEIMGYVCNKQDCPVSSQVTCELK